MQTVQTLRVLPSERPRSCEEKLTDIDDYHWLVGPEAERWLTDCACSAEPSHSLQVRLRKVFSAERARLVVQQVVLRQKAVEKFGEQADRMFFTDVALQQATDQKIAAYKASRFLDENSLVDYCCGIGGDLIAMAGRAPTTGWDRAPEMVLFAQANLRAWNRDTNVQVCIGSVEDHPPTAGDYWHLDPDRRVEGRRSTQIQWHSPDEDTIRNWLATAPHGAIKLAPATQLAPEWQARAELEWITRDRQCRQLVAWFGNLSQAISLRRATVVGSTVSSFVGDSHCKASIAEEISNYVFDTDPAIRAAGLTGAFANSLGCTALATGEAYLTADEPIEHPLLSRFRVIDVLPLRISELAKHVRSLGIRELEIKTRAVAVRPEELRKKLKLTGSASATLLLTRQGKREIAILAERQESAGVTDHETNQ
jgi:hypothetical protein